MAEIQEFDHDLVVIGAGWHGLAAAKTYLEVNPSANVVVLDAAASIGGVWAKHRLYPGLKTNNMLGTYEYSDFPMDTATYGVHLGEHIPGHVVQRYLSDYAEHFGVYKRIRLGVKVESAEHLENGSWIIKLAPANDEKKPVHVRTHRLIIATGLTSDLFLPEFKGAETFGAPLFHSKDFQKFAGTIQNAKSVCVFGGSKSAWDAVYAYASKGVSVDWIIRESGHGPTWMAPPYVTPLKRWLEKLANTRLFTWFSPCIWGDFDGFPRIRSFLHSTAVGRFVVDKFWGILGSDVITLNKYDSHPETLKLKPWTEPIYIAASGLSILNYETNIFDYVKNGTVKVHIADVVNLTPQTVHLSDGQRIPTEAMFCATGWKHAPPLKFLPKGLDLGLPQKMTSAKTTSFITRADAEILSRFPRLRIQPTPGPKFKPISKSAGISKAQDQDDFSSFNLYRFMVPPALLASRSIAFAGLVLTTSTPMFAQTEALWITAYFGNFFANTIPEDVDYETVLHNRFGKWRYPACYGGRFPDFAFDSVPYLDMLLSDLGLESHRKGSMIKEIFEGYGPEDYRGLVDEWKLLRKAT